MSIDQEYLGRGWSFPFGFDSADGGVSMSTGEENIRQCIAIILSTKPGERQMLPTFGCRIHELLFAPNTKATSALIAHHVREALALWEPRIEVTDVNAHPGPNGTVEVRVDYVITATRATQSITQALSTVNR
ncbi:MAG: GPW/gp25 family protein [Alphaproteobacteria bacterium]|nr:GPW/gp25 family protein [Alphaproteobacteria bacterium]